jgi:hypothetical protein
MNDKLNDTSDSISQKLESMKKKPKKEKIEFDDTKPGKIKRTFYLTHYSNNKLNRINAKMLVKGDKISLSELIEKAIDSLYDIEMSERVKNFRG